MAGSVCLGALLVCGCEGNVGDLGMKAAELPPEPHRPLEPV